jgi:hypothetical protein
MDQSRFTRFITRGAPLFFAQPFAVASLALAFGPSPVDALPDGALSRALPYLATIMVLAGYAAYAFAFSRKGNVSFIVAATITCVSLTAISAAGGILLHRDFFTAAFQYAFTFPAVLVLHARLVNQEGMGKNSKKLLANTGFIVAVFYLEWIMLMGYSIATRTEPRPIESMIYNLYNLSLTTVIFFASRSLKRTALNSLLLSRERMVIGDRDVTSLAGLKLTQLLYAFATAEAKSLRCPDIQRILYGLGAGETNEPTSAAESLGPDCARCDLESAKAARCGRYRSTYNSILGLKKFIEFLEIGTIVSGENRRHVLEDGWRLVLFERAQIKLER